MAEPKIPYGRQSVDEDDIEAVARVLRGDWLTQGATIDAFEASIAERVEAKYAVAFANGTASLHAAAAAAGLGVGDVVGVPSLTFAASANSARYVGADVRLLDIESDTLNLDISKVPRDIDGLVAVHFAGLPVDLASIENRPPIVIEDAAHALGAWTPEGPVGNCANSDMTSFSFHPVKPITTGEGGVVTTNDETFANYLRLFRTHGIVKDPSQGGWYYDIPTMGYNYRLTDIHAALGLSQMRKLDQFRDRRHYLAFRYDDLLADLPVILPPQAPEGFGHGHHIYPIRVENRRDVYDLLHAAGIGVQVHYVPLHRLSIYADVEVSCPNVDRAYEGLLSLPLFPTLTDESQDKVVAALIRALDATGQL